MISLSIERPRFVPDLLDFTSFDDLSVQVKVADIPVIQQLSLLVPRDTQVATVLLSHRSNRAFIVDVLPATLRSSGV